MEVSYTDSNSAKAVPAVKKQKGFIIQVASFDNRKKAQDETDSLKKLSYDAYIDRASVNGKDYYRVRIGPIISQKKASSVLNAVQNEDRYRASYMIKE